jgi:predicted ferric reductase
VTGITHTTALWYTSRATGVVSLVLLTAVLVLGMLVNRQGRLPGLPRFAVTGLHRNVSLLSVAFLAIHVLTAIADPYVTIGLAAAVIPFSSGYKPLWLGLGALSLDLIAALILTSLARARMGRRAWRAIHWLAYGAWPLAVAHSLGSSADMRSGVMLGVLIACVLAASAALAWRLSRAARDIPQARRAAATLARISAPAPRRPAQPGFAPGPDAALVTARRADQR